MRLRLAHTLSLWLLGAVALSVLAMGGVSAWQLRQGFSAYLQSRDLERLDKFVVLATSRLSQQQAAAPDGLSDLPRRPDMPALLRELAALEGVAQPQQPTPNRPPFDRAPPGLAPPGGPPHLPPPPRGGPPPPRSGPSARDGDGFGSRVTLVQADGMSWGGPQIAANEPGVVERSIVVAGEVRAIARLRPRQSAPEAHETQFLRSQYLGIVGVASALLLLALGCAFWLARQWARPLAAVQAATARIAQGELDVRVEVERGDEIGDVVRNVNAMAASLQRIEGARRRWLADLSHELRTPLAVLRGEIEALVDGVRPLSAAAMVSLREDVLRLGVLVDDLHLLAMADLKALPCHFDDADASQLITGVLARYATASTQAGLALQGVAATPQALPVRWDALRITQLLDNLLQNSLRYTDAPGRIALAWRAEQDQVLITVDDSAPGVAGADLGRLFDPLFRADAARSREHGGSGLGLAIGAAIVQAHGGRITAGPSALGGLRIELMLPCVAGERL